MGLPEGVSKGIVRPTTKTAPKNPPPKTPPAQRQAWVGHYPIWDRASLVSHLHAPDGHAWGNFSADSGDPILLSELLAIHRELHNGLVGGRHF